MKQIIKNEIMRMVDENPDIVVRDIDDLYDIACDTTINGVRIEDDDILYELLSDILDESFLEEVQDFSNFDVNREMVRDYNSQRL